MPDGARPAPELRLAQPGDLAAMAALLNAVIAEGDKTAIPGPVSAGEMDRYFLSGPDARGCTLALTGGALIGMQALDVHYVGDCGWADIGTFVAAAGRGTGTGRALWQRTRARAQSQGFPGLRAVIRDTNADAIAYYTACGFGPPGPDLPAAVTDLPADRRLLVWTAA